MDALNTDAPKWKIGFTNLQKISINSSEPP